MDKIYTFSCESEEELKSWMNEMYGVIRKYKEKLKLLDIKKK